MKNDRLLRAIRHQAIDRTPIWIMRQAGRYLPEYKATRAKAGSFLKLCKTPELACEVTLQPLARFPLDAAILFSDILTIPDAMGLGLYFVEGEGPCFERTIKTTHDVAHLGIPDPEISLSYVLETIRMLDHELAGKVPLIGFCGSPWTVGCYMVEGKANKNFPTILSMRKENPQLLHELLKILGQSIFLHLSAQINAGVKVVMIFDTWGGLLNTADFQEFSLHYIQHIIKQLKSKHNIPVILFTKGGGQWLEIMSDTGCDVLGIDWLTSLTEARARVGRTVALQGNMNPEVLYGSKEEIETATAKILSDFGYGSGHIFNLGHGILKDVDPEKVSILIEAVQSISKQYHKKESA